MLYNTVELFDMVAQLSDWPTLIAIGNTCVRDRDIVKRIIRRRVMFCISRFLSRESFNRFFELLDITSSALVGGFVRHIMCLDDKIYEDVYPHNMDVIVPIGRGKDPMAARKLTHFLSNAGPCSRVTEVESMSSLRLVSQFTFVCSNDVRLCHTFFFIHSLILPRTIVST